MNEEDCFNYMHELLQHHRDGSHITQTKMSHEASKYVLRDLAKKYAVSTSAGDRNLSVGPIIDYDQ